MKQQAVEYCVDIDTTVRVTVSPQLLGDVLSHLIEDGLQAMPDGGQLDVIGVVTSAGLEIEVSDSSFVFGKKTAHGLELAKCQAIVAGSGMQIDTMSCPQGGVARTLFIPWENRSRAAA